MSEVKIIPTTGRNNCGGRCRIFAHVQDGRIIKLTTECGKGDEKHPPLTACVRGMNYDTTFLNDRRLLYPMKRAGERGSGRFERITWDEALDTIASEWKRIRGTYGPLSTYSNYATGISAMMSGTGLISRLADLDGGLLRRYNSYSTACLTYSTELMYGTSQSGSTMDTILDSRLIILWGHNPQETQFDHSMHQLRMAKKKGIPIVCIDPRRSETCRVLQAEWVGLRPATDAALAAGMAYVIVTEKLYDEDFVTRCCMGFTPESLPEGIPADQCYFAYLSGEQDGVPKTPRWAEQITGVPAETIISLARRYARKPAALICGYGAQRHANGEQGARAQIMLACLTGNVGIRGGWAAGSGYYHAHNQPQMPEVSLNGGKADSEYYRAHNQPQMPEASLDSGKADSEYYRAHNQLRMPQISLDSGMADSESCRAFNQSHMPDANLRSRVFIPCFLWTDAIVRGRSMTAEKDGVRGAQRLDTDIKMLFNLAGNCLINQHSDINRTAEILKDTSKCEFIVVSDLFMTSSAMYADILLPGISFLEGENITMSWERGSFLGYNNKVVEPLGECRFEYDWICDLARRLGLYEEFAADHATVRDWLRDCYEKVRPLEPELPDFDTFRREGGHVYKDTPSVVGFEAQRRDFEHHRFPTNSGKVEIFSPEIWAEHDPEKAPIPSYVPAFEGHEDPLRQRFPLQLIGWHTRRRCHSIGDNNPKLERVDPQRVWMHPEDAGARGIAEGDMVEVFNDRGRTRLPAHLSEDLVRGVAAMAQGAWYMPDDDGVDRNGSINVLTTLRPTPLAYGNPQHSNLVEIVKL